MQYHFRLHKFCTFAAEAPAEVDPAHVQAVRAALRGGVRLQVLRGSVSGLEVRPGAVQVCARGKYMGIIAPFPQHQPSLPFPTEISKYYKPLFMKLL